MDVKDSLRSYFKDILIYLSKMSAFSNELAEKDISLLGSAIFFIAMKTLEQVAGNFCPEEVLPTLSNLVAIDEDSILSISR